MVESTPEEFQNFQKIRELGAGSFGTAYLVKNKSNEKLQVMKVLKDFDNYSPEDEASAVQEAKILLACNHPNIIKCE